MKLGWRTHANWRRRCAFAAALFGWAFLLGCGSGTGAERVVLVTIDTLRADHVSCYGAEGRYTPNIDALAERGVRFETAIAPTPLTLPSHASLMTGLDPPRHGVRNNSTFRLPEEIPTLAERLQGEGFSTAAFIAAAVLDRQYGLARGFDFYDDRMSLRRAADDRGFAERRASRVVDAAIDWLDGAPNRFFLWVHLYDPHSGYDAPRRFRDQFPKSPYAAEVFFADHHLGRLLEAVATRWGDGRTLTVVTSDHGESLGEHGEHSHGYSVYDATQRVPLVMSGAGIPTGLVVPRLVRLVDVAPTILALVGVEALSSSDGADLAPLIEAGQEGDRLAYIETLAPQIDLAWSPLLGVRSNHLKYIRAPRPELYDVNNDPDETRNLSELMPDIVERMDRSLDRKLTGARPVERTIVPDPEQRSRLESLGYVVAPSEQGDQALGQVGGVDPKDGLPSLAQIYLAAALTQENPSEALTRLEQIEDSGPMLDLFRSEAARHAGDAEAAERYARLVLARSQRPDAQTLLGMALLAQGRLQEAEVVLEEAARGDTASANPLVALGAIAEKRGELERAGEFYERAMARRGGNAEARWHLAALRIREHATEEADALLERLPKRELRKPEVVMHLAAAEANAGYRTRALARLERAIRRSPRNARLRSLRDQIRQTTTDSPTSE